MVDPISLRVLIAVLDTGSVTAAARVLDYTAPNVTQHLRKLERRFGTTVVERVGRGVRLTPAGLSIAERARPLIDGLEQLPHLPLVESEPSGTVRIAAFPTALRGLVVPSIAQAAVEHPRLELVPVEMEHGPALTALAVGRLEAVVAKNWGQTHPPAFSERPLARVELGQDPLEAIVPAGHPLAGRDGIELPELAGDRWAICPSGDPYGRWIAAHHPSLLQPLQEAYEAVEFQTLVRFVEAGLAVTVIPRLGRGDLPRGVRAIRLLEPDAHRTVHLFLRPIVADSLTSRTLVQLLRRGLFPGADVRAAEPVAPESPHDRPS